LRSFSSFGSDDGIDVGVNAEPVTGLALPPERVAELLEEGVAVIDVRRTYEFEAGHIPGARNIEMNSLTARAEEISRGEPVLFYCRAGGRSSMAVDAFREAGYDAHNLAGGIEAWVEHGRPLDPADGEIRAPLPPS
jgi:rhodanese-related sulfurtransferase